MVTKILVIGEELKDQLTQYMVVERMEVAKLESIGGVQFDKEVGVVILDTSVVPLVSETFQRLREQVKVPLLAAVSTYEEAKLALELGCEEIVVKPFNLEELKLRVHKVLGLVGSVRLVVGDIVIDLYSRQVRMGGKKYI
jgi:DNA-binding response OmpR family regulator